MRLIKVLLLEGDKAALDKAIDPDKIELMLKEYLPQCFLRPIAMLMGILMIVII